jgi:hypothetical protein
VGRGWGARITAGTSYAQVQNEGGDIDIFGKTLRFYHKSKKKRREASALKY